VQTLRLQRPVRLPHQSRDTARGRAQLPSQRRQVLAGLRRPMLVVAAGAYDLLDRDAARTERDSPSQRCEMREQSFPVPCARRREPVQPHERQHVRVLDLADQQLRDGPAVSCRRSSAALREQLVAADLFLEQQCVDDRRDSVDLHVRNGPQGSSHRTGLHGGGQGQHGLRPTTGSHNELERAARVGAHGAGQAATDELDRFVVVYAPRVNDTAAQDQSPHRRLDVVEHRDGAPPSQHHAPHNLFPNGGRQSSDDGDGQAGHGCGPPVRRAARRLMRHGPHLRPRR
jgi:hypothetical protein